MTGLKFTIALLTVTFALSGCKSKRANMLQGTISLPVTEVVSDNVPVSAKFTGEINGYKTINIDSRTSGYLNSINFKEGSFVKKGTLLYVVEPAPYEAQTAQSVAAVAKAEALLTDARQSYIRIKELYRIDAASKSDLDAATAQFSEATAALVAAHAALTSAQIEQGYTALKSPVDGIIGRTQAQTGALVGAASGVVTLNTVSQVDSVKVLFYVSENAYTKLKENGGFHPMNIQLVTSDGVYYPHKGRFNFLGRAIENQTGAIDAEAIFPNPDTLLRPGQFALIECITDTLKNALLVPQKAVVQIQNQSFVYTLESDGNFTQRNVGLGQTYGNLWVITSGIKAGERVITEGFHKLSKGVKVEPQK